MSGAKEHYFGWLVAWQSVAYLRGNFNAMLLGNAPYLVDADDGSIHQVITHSPFGGDWEQEYLELVRGVRPPDPVLEAVRAALASGSKVAAVRDGLLLAPGLSLVEMKAYVDAVARNEDPPEDLVRRTRQTTRRGGPLVTTVAGPAVPVSDDTAQP
ncbi:hypothetical protein JIG36_10140 [Actinoplanes sp. LDG1-06]|uniref:Immunity protein 35 domain-containing protein n=1 Tax=Paractinoplanes ovalisporus TaxID=2810368 RepID=A0ABS2A7U2_9ACTN|nr:hypothetical protein [Actinoplanes ovalisporus]